MDRQQDAMLDDSELEAVDEEIVVELPLDVGNLSPWPR